MRSTPETWIRTPFGDSMPATSRWKCGDVMTTERGTTPSAKTSPGP